MDAADEDGAIAQLMAFTDTGPETARRYLLMAGGDVQQAIELILEMGGAVSLSGSEEAEEALCANGCGRPAATGYAACCRTCSSSSGASHGPRCMAAWEQGRGPPSLARSVAPRPPRHARLVEHLLSPAVEMQLPADAVDEPARLSDREVARVFTDSVPGVRGFVYREQPGVHALQFIEVAYREGLQAFRGTPLHEHLMQLLRLIVHHGQGGGPGAARHLRAVAEAFMDCQAVQARVIERAGLEIRGVAPDFRGLVVGLVGEYKLVAVKMLAVERIGQLSLADDESPTHYENRLIADLGELLGLNRSDIRLASSDEHARSRFERLEGGARRVAAARCRELFDLDALLQAFAAEVGSLDGDSPAGSLSRLFLEWSAERMTQTHVVLDEDTCMRVEVSGELALAVLEALFLGRPLAPEGETYRGESICGLFRPAPEV